MIVPGIRQKISLFVYF